MNKEEFSIELKKINIELNDDILHKLDVYYNYLITTNKKFNLTSITSENDVYLKHFYDSIYLIKTNKIKDGMNICDFGSGAGFPGIVLAIFMPRINMTLIESNNKKVTFLKELISILELNNIKVISSRMEDYAKNNRNYFDIVTCRAVSNLGIISELSVSTLKINGYFLPLKSYIDSEINKYENLIKNLGYDFEGIIRYELPILHALRSIVVLKKISNTNNLYPRKYSILLNVYK